MLGEIAAHVRLFNGLCVILPTVTLAEGTLANKASALVKLLALRPAHAAHRDEVIGTLWPDGDTDHGANNLYKALHQLRSELPGQEARELVHIRRKIVRLAPWVDVDLDHFRTAAEAATRSGQLEVYERALDLAAGDLLPCDLYEDWAVAVRDEIHGAVRQLRFGAAELCLAQGDGGRAANHLRAVLASDPADERAHLALMRAYAAAGDLGRATRQYDACAAALHALLGLPPSASTTAFYAELIGRADAAPAG